MSCRKTASEGRPNRLLCSSPILTTHELLVLGGEDGEIRCHIAETIRVHPTLSEVVQGSFHDVADVAPTGI